MTDSVSEVGNRGRGTGSHGRTDGLTKMNSPRSIVSRNATPAGGQSESTKGLLELRASELRPGDRVTFGDHTGWYKVLKVEKRGETVRVVSWYQRCGRVRWFPHDRFALAAMTVWVQR